MSSSQVFSLVPSSLTYCGAMRFPTNVSQHPQAVCPRAWLEGGAALAAASCARVVINYDLSKANKLRGPERNVLRGREIVVGSRTVPVSACAKPSENLSEKR